MFGVMAVTMVRANGSPRDRMGGIASMVRVKYSYGMAICIFPISTNGGRMRYIISPEWASRTGGHHPTDIVMANLVGLSMSAPP